MSNDVLIRKNIKAHDRIARKYEKKHAEIFNEIEQERLFSSLGAAISKIKSAHNDLIALDFGCGTGNLTKHLSELGCHVIAADVSSACVELVLSRNYGTKVTGRLLNGKNLDVIPSESVDMVATYSVLHHVPDYLGILDEFVRVLKPGGVVFIDHELCDEYWTSSDARQAFLEEMPVERQSIFRKYATIQNYVNWFMCKFVDRRYRPEGDIHVFSDDHIEWDKIRERLEYVGASIEIEEKYLLYRGGYNLDVYNNYKDKTSDMQLIVARKNG